MSEWLSGDDYELAVNRWTKCVEDNMKSQDSWWDMEAEEMRKGFMEDRDFVERHRRNRMIAWTTPTQV